MPKGSKYLPFMTTSLPMTPNQKIYFKMATCITFKLASGVNLMIGESASTQQKLAGTFLTASSSFILPHRTPVVSRYLPSSSQELQRGYVPPPSTRVHRREGERAKFMDGSYQEAIHPPINFHLLSENAMPLLTHLLLLDFPVVLVQPKDSTLTDYYYHLESF